MNLRTNQITCTYRIIPIQADGSDDPTGLTSVVQDAKAVLPADYSVWKPNMQYTYVLKISTVEQTGLTLDLAVITKWQAGYTDQTQW